jgi:hypothetical protein
MQRHCSIAGRVFDEYKYNILDFSSEHAIASRKGENVFPLSFLFLIQEEASRKPATPFILNEVSCCKVQPHQGRRSSIAATIDKSLFLQGLKILLLLLLFLLLSRFK